MFLQGEFINEIDFMRYELMLKSVTYTMSMTEYCDCYSDYDEDDECFKLHCTFYDDDNNSIEWCIGVEISTLKYSSYREVIDNVLHRVSTARMRLLGE